MKREQRGDEAEFQRGGQALRDQVGDRAVDGVRDSEPAPRDVADIAAELHGDQRR